MGRHAPIIASACLDMVVGLEHLWSRFIPTSDIGRLNAATGLPTVVDPRTVSLIAHMQAGFRETDGAFNPTRLPEQIAAGDGRSLVDDRACRIGADATTFDSLDGIEILDATCVRLPPGMTLDAGGIGKGFAADLVSRHALDLGADAACINLGGDMAITGPSPDGSDWAIDILDPTDPSVTTSSIVVARGGVATSSVSARRRGSLGPVNHIMGSCAGTARERASTVIGATVLASSAAWAEVWSKHAILAPVDRTLEMLDQQGLAALVVTADHGIVSTPTWKEFQP